MEKIEVRVANIDSSKVISFIQTQSWLKAFSEILSPETLKLCTDLEKCTSMIQSVFNSRKGTFYIADLDVEPSGELFWCDAEESQPGCAEIVALHSLEKSWGKGVGKALMNRALQDMSANKKSCAFLWVFKDNIRACRFYEKCGFQPDGTEQLSGFDDAIEIKYTLQLNPMN